jgi:hypothetical protein
MGESAEPGFSAPNQPIGREFKMDQFASQEGGAE